MQRTELFLFLVSFLAVTGLRVNAQNNEEQIFVCFYSAPIQKSISIMYDVYPGIAHTTNGGTSWQRLGYKTSLYNDLVIHPETGDLYAASEYGVLRSRDSGAHWKQLNGWEIQTVFRVCFLFNDIWLATPQGPVVSKDDGASWTLLTKGLQPLNATYVSDMCISEQEILISTADGVYLSTNGGASWQPSGLQGQEIDGVVRHTKDRDVIAAFHHGKGIWISKDNGSTWLERNGDLHSTKVQTLAFDPTDSNILYTGMSDYPVCKSTDGGQTWTTVNRGLSINNITALTVDPQNAKRLFVGTENGLWISNDAGLEWERSSIRFGYISAIVLMEAIQ